MSEAIRVGEVDYLATSRRPAFRSLPPEVRRTVGDLAGSPVVHAAPPVGSGFGGAYAGVLDLADGRRVFAKCAAPTMPYILEATAREAEILPHLTGLRCATRLVGFRAVDVDDPDGAWHVLVLEAVTGEQPGRPWTPQDADAFHEVVLEIATSDVTPPDVRQLSDDLGAEPRMTDALLAVTHGSRAWPSGHVVPEPADLAEMVRLSRRIGEVMHGDALLHCDLRPDNLLREPSGRMRAVDWNHLRRGAPWVDLVLGWPLMHRQGVDPARFEGSPLLAGVPEEDVDVLLAWFVGFMLVDIDEPPPPTCTEALRRHQAYASDTTLRLLAHRRGWRLTG